MRMKRRAGIVSIVLLFSLMLWACGKEEQETALHAGTYQMECEDEEAFFVPGMTLKEDGECYFFTSMLSSYMYIGTWEIQDKELILKGDDGAWEYRFVIQAEDAFTFDEENSSKVITYKGDVPVADGAKFVLVE